MSERLLEGRGVLVTGGGRGLGRAHALACAAAGARVFVNDLGCDTEGQGADPSVAAEVVEQIRASGGEAFADAADVASAGAARALVNRACAALGRLDVVVGAAGVMGDRRLLPLSEETLDRVLDVHVRGSFGLVRAAARVMVDAGNGGSIVLHGGPVGMFGAARQSALGAASAAVVGLTRSGALELRKHRVRLNAIAATARTRTTEGSALFRGIAPGSMSPEHVAAVGVFLASDLSSEITGELVGVAGSRLYVITSRESAGWFGDGGVPTPEEIRTHWHEVGAG